MFGGSFGIVDENGDQLDQNQGENLESGRIFTSHGDDVSENIDRSEYSKRKVNEEPNTTEPVSLSPFNSPMGLKAPASPQTPVVSSKNIPHFPKGSP